MSKRIPKRKNPIWGLNYDMHTDKCYNCPCCPECKEPIKKDEDGNYRCFLCGELVNVTDGKMKEWLKDREGTKTEYCDCLPKIRLEDGTTMGCGGKKCVETHYRKNPVTLEWQIIGGKCTKCRIRFIV